MTVVFFAKKAQESMMLEDYAEGVIMYLEKLKKG